MQKREVRKRNLDRFRKLDASWIDRNLERHMLIRARSSAKRRGHEFNIDLTDIVIPETCPLLGFKLERRTDGSRKKRDNTPSLDRIDSSNGYVKGNVWVISWRANHLKSDGTLKEFEALVFGLRTVGAHMNKLSSRRAAKYFREHLMSKDNIRLTGT